MADLTTLPQPGAACMPPGVIDQRGKDAFRLRFGTATWESSPTGTIKHTANTDEANIADKSGTYTKCLLQKGYGVVDPNAFSLFRTALGKSDGTNVGSADFEVAGLLGLGRKLNGPLGAFALTLAGADSQNFGDMVVPPAPGVGTQEYALELIELYWASLLRDVPFTEYGSSEIGKEAVKELNAPQHLAHYAGPVDSSGQVTADLLFRGEFNATRFPAKAKYFAGEDVGPYISQLCIRPTMLGAQPIDQKLQSYVPNLDYMTDLETWARVQNGWMPTVMNTVDDEKRYLHNGRGLAAFTHIDELYQAYLTAYLVLGTMGIGPNPSNPYSPPPFIPAPGGITHYKNQQPFGTFGGPDIVSTLGAVAKIALESVWYQKWIIHLRHRPESGGGIVHLMKNPMLGHTDAHVDQLVIDSKALKQSNQKYGSYLLSQAFPEGSPAHPAYPTGHGTVAGACITVLKFFFDGNAPIPNPMVPSADGLSLCAYPGSDIGQMTVNGELHKLAHNISFGHGIHGGIHWRSDTDYSILLGEAVALKFLQDQAYTYRENIAIEITKIDGTKMTIQNF
jgi:hypothetical protein